MLGLASADVLAAVRCFADALHVLFGLHPGAVHVCSVHVCSCNTCTGGSHVTSILHWSRTHMWMFQIAINNLLKWLFSRVLASHRRGPDSIPGRHISVLGPLVQNGDDLSQVSSLVLYFFSCIGGAAGLQGETGRAVEANRGSPVR